MSATITRIDQAVVAVMVRHFTDTPGANWIVAHSAEEDAAAVVFRGAGPEGALPGVRRRHIAAWEDRLVAAGLAVERRFDGPRGLDLEAPWWLRVTTGRPCAECPTSVPVGTTYCSTRCRNAADRHDDQGDDL